MPLQVVDRLGEDVVREMIEVRRAGTTFKDLAERCSISESSVKRLMRRHMLADKHSTTLL